MKCLAIAFSVYLLSIPLYANAAITFDNSAVSSSNSFSYTTSGMNRALIVGAYENNGTDNVTAPTYGGVSMTLISKVQLSSANYTYQFGMINPAVGSNTLTFSTGDVTSVAVASYDGVSQTGFPDSKNTANINTSSGSTESVTDTTIANNAWTVLTYMTANSIETTAGTNSTQRQFSVGKGVYDSNGAITPAGNFTMSLSAPSGDRASLMIVGLAPAATVIVSYPTKICLGAYCFFQ